MYNLFICFYSQVLYDDKYYVATRHALSSLAGDNDIDKTVINIWVHILNVREQYRDRSGVHRVFFTSEALVSQSKKDSYITFSHVYICFYI